MIRVMMGLRGGGTKKVRSNVRYCCVFVIVISKAPISSSSLSLFSLGGCLRNVLYNFKSTIVSWWWWWRWLWWWWWWWCLTSWWRWWWWWWWWWFEQVFVESLLLIIEHCPLQCHRLKSVFPIIIIILLTRNVIVFGFYDDIIMMIRNTEDVRIPMMMQLMILTIRSDIYQIFYTSIFIKIWKFTK